MRSCARRTFGLYRIGSVPHRLSSRPPSAIAITTRISSGRGASATETVIVSKCGKGPGIVLVPERHAEDSARSGHLHIRSDYRPSAADRGPHRFFEHRVKARAAMLISASDTDDRALP